MAKKGNGIKTRLHSAQGDVWIEDEIDVKKAEAWLEKLHPSQRNVRRHHVSTMANAMRTGRFKFTADPIRFDNKGQLIDGQHRLRAVVEAGVPIYSVVCARLRDSDVAAYIDTVSAPRSVHDARGFMGLDRIPAPVTSALVYDFCDFHQESYKLLSIPERIELVEQCQFKDVLVEFYRLGQRKVGLTAGPLAGAVRCVRASPERAYRFFVAAFGNDPTVEGEHCAQAKLLADWLLNDALRRRGISNGRGTKKGDEQEGAFKAVMAFNAWRKGQSLSKLIHKGGDVPLVVV